MERDKSLKIMNVTAASLFGLTVLIYLFVTAFPQGVLNLFIGKTDVELSAALVARMLIGAVKPLIFAVIGVIGFTRKKISFKYGMITAVGSGILWLFPPSALKLYFMTIFYRVIGSAEEIAYLSALNNAVDMFGFLSSAGILLIFGSAVSEMFIAKKHI